MIKKYEARNGQDEYILENVFKEKKEGYFVDLGAFDGKQYSNTWYFEKELGWDGICIEASTEKFELLKKSRSCICLNDLVWDESGIEKFFYKYGLGSGLIDEHARHKSVENKEQGDLIKKTTTSFVSILEKHDAPKYIDFLSIDVEGAEEKIINEELLNKYSFGCICIEIYKDLNNRYASDLHNLFKDYGYKCIQEMAHCDYVYVPKDD